MAKKQSRAKLVKKSLPIIVIAGALAAVAGFGAVYVNLGGNGNVTPAPKTQSGKPAGEAANWFKAYSKGHMITFVARSEPQDLPDFTFEKVCNP